MDEENSGIDIDHTHKRAVELIPEEFFWSCIDELSPFGSDEGEEAPVDEINSYGFPLTYYTSFGGKCGKCYDKYVFQLLYLLADIGLIAVFTFLAIRLKNKIPGITTILLTIISFTSCRQTSKQITSADLKGNWHLNKWTSYQILIISDQTVFVGNHVDTVFTLNYSLSHDTLITWTGQSTQKFKNKIISLTKDNLVLDGIQEITETRTYKRTKETQNK
jgi:hypothetical protein